MHAAEPLPHFVDDYLAFLYEVHPTGATMDGVHVHDDLLETTGARPSTRMSAPLRDSCGGSRAFRRPT